MVALSESVMKNRLKRPQADKSQWRYIRLAIKPRYLGNYASQIKSYYGTLSGSDGRSFRIRHKNSLEAPRWGEITEMSYPACNTTLLTWKTCITYKKLIWNKHYEEVRVALSESVTKIRLKRPLAQKSRWRHIRLAIKSRYLGNHASQIRSDQGTQSGSQGRSFIISHEKSLEAPASGEITMTSYTGCIRTSLSRKPCITYKKLIWKKQFQEVRVTLSESAMKSRLKRPLAEKSRWLHIRLAIKRRYLGNHASQIKSDQGTLSGSHVRSFIFRHEKSPAAPASGEITMTSYTGCFSTSLPRKPWITDEKLLWNKHYPEVMVALSGSEMKNRLKPP